MIPAFSRAASPPVSIPRDTRDATLAARRGNAAPSPFAAFFSRFGERLGRYLLLAAMFTLLVRPADLFPVLDNAPIYETLIVSCLLVSLRGVARQVMPHSLRTNAILLCSCLLVATVMVSHLAQGNTFEARIGGTDMLKALVVLVLVIHVIDTPAKLRGLLAVAAGSVTLVAALAVLHFHGVIHLQALASVEQRFADPAEAGVLRRLCGVGIFNDPNDFALMLVFAAVVCLAVLTDRRAGVGRVLVLAPIALLAYSLHLTHSRGGLLSAMAATITFLMARLGWKRTLPIVLAIIPAVLIFLSRRQTSIDFSDPEDTFQTRLGLWSDALDLFRSSPLTGIGQGRLVEETGQVAHNSFLHAFAELGVLGGAAFLGAFLCSVQGIWRSGSSDRTLWRLRPAILAIVVGYGAGLLSLSRCYTVPTQFILGIATAYLLIVARSGGAPVPQCSWRLASRVAGMSAVFLLATYVFVRVMIQRGGA